MVQILDELIVAIPTVDPNSNLIPMIESLSNTPAAIPRRLIVVNNSPNPICPGELQARLESLIDGLSVIELIPGAPMTCNQSWNRIAEFAAKADSFEIIGVLNDDLLMHPQVFERIAAAFEIAPPDVGVIVPSTIHASLLPIDTRRLPCHPALLPMKRREGWAMFFKQELYSTLPLIPDQLRQFCGDDWYWAFSRRLGYFWRKDIHNPIFHKVGRSVNNLPEKRELLSKEKRLLPSLISEALECAKN